MKAFLVLGGWVGCPWGRGAVCTQLGLLPAAGLTLQPVPWQKGQGARLLLIHMPGSTEYKTNIQMFTVSGAEGGHGEEAAPGHIHIVLAVTLCLPNPQVVGEVLEELCGKMGITDSQEVQEFALFLIKGNGEPCEGGGRRGGGAGRAEPEQGSRADELVRPLWSHEYLNSVLVHEKVSLHSRRLCWETPLHFDNSIYISTHFSQVSPHPTG